jgi:hypothetical protein
MRAAGGLRFIWKASMLRLISAAALAASLLFAQGLAQATSTEPAHRQIKHKRPHLTVRHWHGYGFLPGYRPPEVIARERAERNRYRPQIMVFGDWMDNPLEQPRFFHGRWNGGGFGPCWTYTPIGMMWNCGQ